MAFDILPESRGLGGFVVIRARAWLVYPVLFLLALNGGMQTAILGLSFIEPEQAPADEQCREIVRGAVALKMSTGILCVRPVHFIANHPSF